MKKDEIYLKHIFEAIIWVEKYIHDLEFEGFMDNHLIQDGVIRQIEIIGEATKKLSSEIRDNHGKIPWKDLAGMRDKLIHDYFGVDLEAVWKTAINDIPWLKEELKKSFN